jgi:MFS family permease
MISGFLLTMMNPIALHLTRFYKWGPDVAQQKFVLLSTILTIGSALGCLVAGNFIGWGRRRTLIVYCITTLITTAMSLSGNEIMLFAGRFIVGIFFGIHGAVFPLYNFEMSP